MTIASNSAQVKSPSNNVMSTYECYIRDVNQHKSPRLSREDEFSLGTRIQNGDKEAENELVQRYTLLVVGIANGFAPTIEALGGNYSVLDLIQEGNKALIEAAKKYKPERGFRFTTPACTYVRNAMRAVIKQTVRGNRSHPTVSLEDVPANRQQNGKGRSFMETLPDPSITSSPHAVYEKEEQLKLLEHLLSRLKPRDRRVLELAWGVEDGKEWSFAEIGRELSISRERVRQIYDESFNKLQKFATQMGTQSTFSVMA